MRRTNATWFLVSLFLFLAACSGKSASTGTGGSGGSGTLASISVTPASTSISVSAQVSFKAMGIYSDGSSKDLTASAQWASSDFLGICIHMTPAGVSPPAWQQWTATISQAQSVRDDLARAVTLTVSASGGSGGGGGDAGKNLASIAVTPLNPSVPENTVQQLTATGTYTDGSSADLTSLVTWTSSAVSNANVKMPLAQSRASLQSSASIKWRGAGTAFPAQLRVTVTAPSITAISVSLGRRAHSPHRHYSAICRHRDLQRWIEPGPRQRRRLELLVDLRSHHRQYGFGIASRRRNSHHHSQSRLVQRYRHCDGRRRALDIHCNYTRDADYGRRHTATVHGNRNL